MPLLTLSQARTALWTYGSTIPYAARTADDILTVTNIINLACLRLRDAINFRGAFATARLRVFDEQITLPSPLEGIRSLRIVNDDGTLGSQYQVYSRQANFRNDIGFYDCLDFGPWPIQGGGNYGVRDMGDGFPTFRDPPGTFYIRCKSTIAETGTTILLKGLDENGNQIYTSTNTEGVSLAVTTATTTTTQKFTELASWVKAAATNGVIGLYSVDTTTGDEEALVNITPNKLTSGYRRYSAKGFTFGQTIEALCNVAILPAVADNDPIIPANLGALRLAMMALQFENRNDTVNAPKYWGPNHPEQNPGVMIGAVDLLEKERDNFDGDEVSTVVFSGFARYDNWWDYNYGYFG